MIRIGILRNHSDVSISRRGVTLRAPTRIRTSE